jgi:beta-mannosidase
MVWQDLMFARLDPPDDPAFDAVVEAEVGALCTRLAASPSTAVVCGGSEVHQQPAMLGLPAGRRAVPLLDDRVPQWVHRRLPATPYLPSSPYGDGLAFRPGGMATHYFGVGAYGRPVQDALLAGVGFASECLAFAVPPGAAGRRALDDADPDGAWRARVPQDSGADWTFADVTERYARRLAGAAYPAEPADPDLAHDLAGATAATVMAAVVAGWRAPGSGCRGALLIASHDQVAGSGWGLIDAAGMPKAAYWGVRRVMAPVALLLLDRGLDGLRAVVVNDGPEDLAATLTVRCLQGDRLAEHAGRPITVPAHGSVARDVELLLDGFRDLTHAYGFGPPAYSCVEVVCESSDGRHIGSAVYVPGGSPIEAAMAAAPAGPVVSGRIVPAGSGAVALEVAATGLAIAVEVDAPGWDPADSWFDLAPGSRRTVELRRRHPGDAPPVVTLRPLGSPPVVLGSAGAGS